MSSDGDDFVDPMGAASADERLQEGQTVGEERRREKGTGSAKGREEKDEVSITKARQEWHNKMSMLVREIAIEAENVCARYQRLGNERDEQLANMQSIKEEALKHLEGHLQFAMISTDLLKQLQVASVYTVKNFNILYATATKRMKLFDLCSELCGTEDEKKVTEGLVNRVKKEKMFTDIMGTNDMNEWVEQVQNMKGDLRRKDEEIGRLREQIASFQEMPLAVGSEGGARGDVVDREISEGERNMRRMYKLNAQEFRTEHEEMEMVSAARRADALGFRDRRPPLTGEWDHIPRSSASSDYGGSTNVDSMGTSRVLKMFVKAQLTSSLGDCSTHTLEDFEIYMRRFESRYEILNEVERRDQLALVLKGAMKRTFEKLPRSVQTGSYQGLVDALKEELRGDVRLRLQRATEKLRVLKMDEGKMREYCDELERLSSIAWQGITPDVMSRMRATEFWAQIRSGPLGTALIDTYETAKEGEVYSTLKTKALRMERQLPSGNHARNFQQRDNHHRISNAQGYRQLGEKKANYNGSSERKQTVTDRNYGKTNGEQRYNSTSWTNHAGVKCYSCQGLGHYADNCPKNKGISPATVNSSRCYECQGSGHQARDCPRKKASGSNATPLGNRAGAVFVADNSTAESKPTITELMRSLPVQKMEANGVSTMSTSPSSPLYGEKCLRKVQFLGHTRNMLIDSGAQPSLIQYGWLQDADRRGVCLDRELQSVESEGQGVFNVSGGQMKVLCIVNMEVQLADSNRKARIPFHVVDEGVNATREPILGTNAFEALGIKIVLSSNDNDSSSKKQSYCASGGENQWKDSASGGEEKNDCASGGESSLKKGNQYIVASVVNRVVIEPGNSAAVAIAAPTEPDGAILFLETGKSLSDHGCIVEGIGVVKKEQIEVWASNPFTYPVRFRRGQVVGTLTSVEIQDPMTVNATEMLDQCTLQETSAIAKEQKLLDMLIKEKDHNTDYGEELKSLLREFSDVFATEDAELKQTTWVEHHIDTGDAEPIRQRCRPVPLGIKGKFREILKGLLERGIVEKSTSPWASPIVLVKKKDGSIRLCIDFRELNKVVKLDSYPLPSIDVLLQQLNGKSVFSTLDLHSGFWQIGLHEDSRQKTAFISTEGLYQFRVLPFGLATSPATFQRMMDEVLKELVEKGDVNVYVDDILIATDSHEKHLKVMREVFAALRQANLAIRAQKTRLFEREVPYLGHLISGNGVQTDPKKVSAIKEYKTPATVAELRTFLGMTGYYRKFVHHFAKKAQPLFDLTKQEMKWVWGKEQQAAFDALKDAMCKSPILVQPDMASALDGTNPFVIFTDASMKGVGGVLTQADKDGYLHPIAFASKGLSKTECNYHVTDLEALAIVYCVKKFHHFLYGAKNTVVRTDHQALVSLFKRTVTGRLLRWSMIIQDAQVRIEYVKGKANVVADALSRGVQVTELDSTVDEGLEAVVIAEVTAKEKETTDWLEELRRSEVYSKVISALEEGREAATTTDLQGIHKKFKISDFEIVQDNLFLWKSPYVKVKVVPLSKRKALFDEVHKGKFAGHFATAKIVKMLANNYFWESMSKDVAKWYAECVKCFVDNHRQKLVPPLKPWVTAQPYEVVGIDVMDLGRTESDNRYVVAVIDHFSKWAGSYAVPDKKAVTIAKVIVERWIGEGGRWPKQFLSDQGGEFVNAIIEKIQEMTGIDWVTTKGYLPRENGLTERFNGTLQRALRKSVQNASDWDQMLPFVLYAYNTTPHESTGESPFFLLHGFDPVLVSQAEVPRLTLHMVDKEEYVTTLVDSLNRAKELAREKNEAQRAKMKAWYDRHFGIDRKIYPVVGERVFMRVPGCLAKSRNPKLAFDVAGPYRVLEVSENSALITEIGAQKEPLRIQFDLLLRIPDELEVENEGLKVKKGRKSNRASNNVGSVMVNCVQVNNDVFFSPMHADFRCGKLPTAGEEPCVWRKLSLRAWIGYCRGTSFPTTFEDVDLSDYTASQLVLVCHVWQNERLWASERVETIRKKDFEGVEVKRFRGLGGLSEWFQVEAHSIRSAWIGLTKICRCCLVESLMKVVYPDAEGWRSFVPRELPDLQEIWKCVKRGDDGFPKWNRLWKDVWVLERTVLEKLNGHLVSDFGYILPFTEESLLKAKGMGDLRRVYVSLPLATKEGQLESCLDRINHLCQKKGVSALILTPLLPIENILDFNKLCKEYVNKITGWKENMEKSKRRIHISANMYDGEGWIPFGSHAAALRTTTRLTTADVAAYGLQLGNDLKKYSVRHMFVKGNLRHVNGSPKAPSVSERAGYHPLSGVEPSSGKRRGCAADSAVPPKRGFYRG